MLRIIQNSASASAKSYYAHSDYLSEGQELTGRWGGRTALMLGLTGDVDKLSFDRLCDNLDPRSGKQLTLRTKSDRTVGYDFNFHLPKGVSLAYTLGQDDRILDAFRDSVDETMREIELEAKTRVRKHGVEADRTVGNLVWAQFIHKTARPVNGEPDPLLHAHCFCFNSVWDMKEQAFKAGQFRDLKRDAPYFQAAFHARMAMRMRGLGYEIRRDGKNWDIATIPKALCDKFSRRKEQIEEYARVNGVASEAEKADLGARTREKKESGLSMPELQELWNQRLTDDERQLFASHPKTSTPIVSVTPELAQESASLSHATNHCLERHSVVPMKTLLAEALRHGVGKVSVEGMYRQLDLHRIIRREVENRMMATSPEVLAEEQEMLRFARSGVGRESALNPSWTIQQEWLNADQKDAVRHVLNSKDLVMVIRGGAGTGKTSLMREAVNGIEATGRKVYTFAPSSDASRGVLRSKGFEATTVAELLVNPELQQATKDNVVWIDEAGLLGSRTLKKVMDIAAKNNSRIVLSGDWRQHGSVERGAAMRLLEHQAGIRPAVVKTIQRQDGAYRDAVSLLADGYTAEGFEALNKMGWIREIEDEGDRYRAIAHEFADIIDRKEEVLATAPTHAEGELLTAAIRHELTRRGVISEESKTLQQLKPLRLTHAEKAEGERISQGDVLVFTQNAKGFKRGQRVEIKGELPENLRELASRFEVYKKDEIQLAQGDLIRITAGGKTRDGKHRLDNGNIYQIRSFTEQGDIRLQNGWVVSRDYGFMTTGYVSTSHAAQGKTVKHVLVAESSMSYPAAGREQFYVSISRGEKSATIFTDNQAALAEAVEKSDRRMGATELFDNRVTTSARQARRAKTIRRQQEPVTPKTRERIHERE